MLKHEEKYCPRCKNIFECKVGSIALCQCTAVSLNEKEREFMKNNFEDCLCASCMKVVKSEFQNQELKDKMKSILGGAMKFNSQDSTHFFFILLTPLENVKSNNKSIDYQDICSKQKYFSQAFSSY